MLRICPTSSNNGFTLVELMIALVISSLIVLGIISAYVSISGLVNESKRLQQAQDVILFSMQVFGKSIKNVSQTPIVTADSIQLQHDYQAGQPPIVTCQGALVSDTVTETYTFVQPNLLCDDGQGNGAIPIITNLSDAQFELIDNNHNGIIDLVRITVNTDGMPDTFVNGVSIEFALRRLIIQGA